MSRAFSGVSPVLHSHKGWSSDRRGVALMRLSKSGPRLSSSQTTICVSLSYFGVTGFSRDTVPKYSVDVAKPLDPHLPSIIGRVGRHAFARIKKIHSFIPRLKILGSDVIEGISLLRAVLNFPQCPPSYKCALRVWGSSLRMGANGHLADMKQGQGGWKQSQTVPTTNALLTLQERSSIWSLKDRHFLWHPSPNAGPVRQEKEERRRDQVPIIYTRLKDKSDKLIKGKLLVRRR